MINKKLMNIRAYTMTIRSIIDYIRVRINNKNIVVKVRPPLLIRGKGSLKLYVVEYDDIGLVKEIEAFSLDGHKRMKTDITWLVKSYNGNIKLVYKGLVDLYKKILNETIDLLENIEDGEVSLL